MMKEIYILAAKQISVQKPLVEDWLDNPEHYDEPYVRSIDSDYKEYFPANTVQIGRASCRERV